MYNSWWENIKTVITYLMNKSTCRPYIDFDFVEQTKENWFWDSSLDYVLKWTMRGRTNLQTFNTLFKTASRKNKSIPLDRTFIPHFKFCSLRQIETGH